MTKIASFASRSKKTLLTVFILTVPLLLFTTLSALSRTNIIQAQPSGSTNTFLYLPLVSKPVVYFAPEFIGSVTLPGALCPQEVGVNPITGIAYVTNHDSNNVSLLKDGALIGTVTTGEWPTLVSSSPVDNRSFVTNLHGGVSYFEGDQLKTTIMPAPATPGGYGEPYAAAYNPVNGYTYIIHIGGGGVVQVVNGTQTIANIPLLQGWILDVKVDLKTGLVYVANWERGLLFVIQGTSVINTLPIGWGPDKLAVDETHRYIYAAHTSPNSQYPHNISVTNLDTNQVTAISTANASRRVAVDRLSGLAYVTNPDADTVSILQGPSLLRNLPTGNSPWGVAVHEASGYAFVTNKLSNSVTVLRHGEFVSTLPVGDNPIGVAVDVLSNYVYVVNETSYDYCNSLNQCYKVCQQPASVSVYQIPTNE